MISIKWWWMNWKGYGRKQSQTNLRYCLDICLDGRRKTIKFVRIASLWFKMWPPIHEVTVATTWLWCSVKLVKQKTHSVIKRAVESNILAYTWSPFITDFQQYSTLLFSLIMCRLVLKHALISKPPGSNSQVCELKAKY